MPVAPAFGGKLNSTIASLRARPRSARRSVDEPRRRARRASRRARDATAMSRRPSARRRAGAAAEGHRPDRAVEFRDRDHHRGFDRQSGRAGRPATARASGTRPGAPRGRARRAGPAFPRPRARRCRRGRRPARSRSARPPRRPWRRRPAGRSARSPGAQSRPLAKAGITLRPRASSAAITPS